MQLHSGGSQTKWHAELQSRIPALQIGTPQRGIHAVIGQHGIVAVLNEIAAKSIELIGGNQVQLGVGDVFGRTKLQFQALDLPFLPTQFRTPGQRIQHAGFPLHHEFCFHWIVVGADDLSIVDGQPQEFAELIFRHENVRQCLLGLGLRREIILACLGFVRSTSATRPRIHLRLHFHPRTEHAFAVGNHRIPIAVGEIQIPVTVLDVLDHLRHGQFKVDDINVTVDARDRHPLGHAGDRTQTGARWTGDACVFHTGSSPQWLGVHSLQRSVVSGRDRDERRVRTQVIPIMVDGEVSTVRHGLGQTGCE